MKPTLRTVPLDVLVLDGNNANKGTKRGRALLEKSLESYGAGRSVVVDRKNRVIAGNETVEAARAAGMQSITVVETDGSSLVAVQRGDLDLKKDKKARELAIADNRVSEIDLEWNPEVLASLAVDLEMRLNPGFSAIAVLTLALGIGANTAIFSIVDGVLIRPLGYGDENRLVVIHEVVPKFSGFFPKVPVNAMHFLEWRKRTSGLERMAMIGGMRLDLTGTGEPERLGAARVSPDLFPMLGARTQLGRTFWRKRISRDATM